MTLFSKPVFWLRRQITISRLERVDARMLADMGIPADDIAGFVQAKFPTPTDEPMARSKPAASGMPLLSLRTKPAC